MDIKYNIKVKFIMCLKDSIAALEQANVFQIGGKKSQIIKEQIDTFHVIKN